ncbi:MAG: acylneuraminate cytidylyltransferase family protein [Pseudomonadota bacterium]
MEKITALMPMRHSSERVPGKNYRPFGDGRPLFYHMLDTLLSCDRIETVVINTDSPTIEELCARDFPDVRVTRRPDALLGGDVPMNDILAYDVERAGGAFFLQTHSTNPLVKKETVQRAVDCFFEQYPIYDSLFSVTQLQTRLYDQLARPINHNANILLRTQDLPSIYEENSCLYIFEAKAMRETGMRIGRRPWMFPIDPIEAADIDVEFDFSLAEMSFKLLRGQGGGA